MMYEEQNKAKVWQMQNLCRVSHLMEHTDFLSSSGGGSGMSACMMVVHWLAHARQARLAFHRRRRTGPHGPRTICQTWWWPMAGHVGSGWMSRALRLLAVVHFRHSSNSSAS